MTPPLFFSANQFRSLDGGTTRPHRRSLEMRWRAAGLIASVARGGGEDLGYFLSIMAHVMRAWAEEGEGADLMECRRLEEEEEEEEELSSVDAGVREVLTRWENLASEKRAVVQARLARSRWVRPTNEELAGFDALDGAARDGVAEQCEEILELDGRETLRGEEVEGLEVSRSCSRLTHSIVPRYVERARRQPETCSVVGEGVLESAGGGVVVLAAIAD